MLKKLLASSLLLSSIGAYAGDVSLDYKGFYDRLKRVNKEDYSLITMAFYVPNSKNCKIISGKITTERKSYPLIYNKDQQLLLPYDEKLRSDRALIQLNLAGDTTRCGIQVQIASKTKQKHYEATSLQQMFAEMDALYTDLQGFPMKYFSKGISGISFNFQSVTQIKVNGVPKQVEDKFVLTESELKKLKHLEFSNNPVRISPWFNH
ncbi:DUF2987 domain-containing protein [Parashewanella curva]|uniref:DUF2987 domain-containing protein n=1 Tax=Parashewanella curva TaxID=2338552 RepID=A0A3L8PST4_9GAMM|nr:DUF2987 domain-containing protein [Parashewanella curva]RLV58480.1 DUF2987 domain-containing protein [Parashewanella curva]